MEHGSPETGGAIILLIEEFIMPLPYFILVLLCIVLISYYREKCKKR